tara:strand:- start:3308 stop:3982 length:675 start_codon:yes stop_codon:yes gene_type:complete
LKIQKKIINVLYLLIINFRNYGFSNFSKIIFYEIKNILRFGFSDLFYDQSNTKNSYKFTKTNIESTKITYDATYLPTPYFFLEIIKAKLDTLNTKKFIFLDFGCGAGRVLNFFSKEYNELIGIDKNSKYRKFFTKKNQKFFKLDLNFVQNLNKIKFSSKKIILYFFNPFDLSKIIKIINFFTINKYEIIVITVNCAPIKSKKISKIYNKKFLNKNIGISIYKNY